MSQATAERFVPHSSSARAEQITDLLAFQKVAQADEKFFGSLPILFDLQTRSGKYAEAVPFIGLPLKSALDLGLSGIKNLATRIINRPFRPITESSTNRQVVLPSKDDSDQEEIVQQKVLAGIMPNLRSHSIGWQLPTLSLMTAGLALYEIACSFGKSGPEITISNPPAATGDLNLPKPTNTPDAKSTPTPASIGGSEAQDLGDVRANAIRDRLVQIQKKQAEGKELNATDLVDKADILYFNKVAEKIAAITTWTTEKGEIKQLPQIDGLRSSYLATSNRLEIAYITQENNPYGLEAGKVAGMFHKEVFNVKDNLESANQTGGIAVRKEVWTKMIAGSIDTPDFKLPIPIDLTNAEGDKKLLIQISKANSPNGINVLWLHAPKGSKIVVLFDDIDRKGDIETRTTPQDYGTLLVLGRAPIQKQYALYARYSGNEVLAQSGREKIGAVALDITSQGFSGDLKQVAIEKYIPSVTINPNLMLHGQQVFMDANGKSSSLGLKESNALKVNDVPVLTMANDNSLLQ